MKQKIMLMCMKLCFMLSITITSHAQQPSWGRLLWNGHAWVNGNFHASSIFGNIGSATPGGSFGTQSLLTILESLAPPESSSLDDGIYTLLSRDLYRFQTTVSEETYRVFLPLPDGYRLKPNGLFMPFIAGWDEYGNQQIIYGQNYVMEGFVFAREDHPYLVDWTIHGFIELEQWSGYTFPTDFGDGLSLVTDLETEKFGEVLRW